MSEWLRGRVVPDASRPICMKMKESRVINTGPGLHWSRTRAALPQDQVRTGPRPGPHWSKLAGLADVAAVQYNREQQH